MKDPKILNHHALHDLYDALKNLLAVVEGEVPGLLENTYDYEIAAKAIAKAEVLYERK
jgi:hypothetical protein